MHFEGSMREDSKGGVAAVILWSEGPNLVRELNSEWLRIAGLEFWREGWLEQRGDIDLAIVYHSLLDSLDQGLLQGSFVGDVVLEIHTGSFMVERPTGVSVIRNSQTMSMPLNNLIKIRVPHLTMARSLCFGSHDSHSTCNAEDGNGHLGQKWGVLRVRMWRGGGKLCCNRRKANSSLYFPCHPSPFPLRYILMQPVVGEERKHALPSACLSIEVRKIHIIAIFYGVKNHIA